MKDEERKQVHRYTSQLIVFTCLHVYFLTARRQDQGVTSLRLVNTHA